MDGGTIASVIVFVALVGAASIALLVVRSQARKRSRRNAELALDRLASRVCSALEDDPDVEERRTQSLLSWYARLGDDMRRARSTGEYRRVAWSARAATATDSAWERGQRVPGGGRAEDALFGGARVAGGVAAVAWAAWRSHGDEMMDHFAKVRRGRAKAGTR